MNWKDYFNTSVGKQLQMSFTGIFLILFLIIHCYVNAQVFYNDGGIRFNEAAHFMGTNFVIRIIEIGLFAFLLLHTIQGLSLWAKNRSRRSVGSSGNKTTPWYRRSMALLGTLVLLFLILHLYQFWGPNRLSQFTGGGELNLYGLMKEEFRLTWVLVAYLGGCIALGWHLAHGFYSAFQHLGFGTHRYKNIIKGVSVAFAIIVPLIFAVMPVAFYMQWIV
jgi:succinate dehydrogenase / fumarate reductase, cytochrome b subunit